MAPRLTFFCRTWALVAFLAICGASRAGASHDVGEPDARALDVVARFEEAMGVFTGVRFDSRVDNHVEHARIGDTTRRSADGTTVGRFWRSGDRSRLSEVVVSPESDLGQAMALTGDWSASAEVPEGLQLGRAVFSPEGLLVYLVPPSRNGYVVNYVETPWGEPEDWPLLLPHQATGFLLGGYSYSTRQPLWTTLRNAETLTLAPKSVTVAGRTCHHLTARTDFGVYNLWLDEETHVPVRLEMVAGPTDMADDDDKEGRKGPLFEAFRQAYGLPPDATPADLEEGGNPVFGSPQTAQPTEAEAAYRRTVTIEWAPPEQIDGRPVPTAATLVFADESLDGGGRWMSIEARLLNVELDPPALTPGDLDLPAPDGTPVRLAGIPFIAHDGLPREWRDGKVIAAVDESAAADIRSQVASVAPAAQSPSSAGGWGIWILAGIAVVLAAIALWFLKRHSPSSRT